MKVKVVTRILEANDRIAEENRRRFKDAGVYVVNLMGAPGAGKTTLLERTIKALKPHLKIGVIEGDIVGTDDAERISALDVPVVQINTGGACHLDANMISEVLDELPLSGLDMLIIENVGNLVCPAEFRVGEDMKMMVLSIAEGHDKPLKYPLMFRESSALVLNKIDLLPYMNTDMNKVRNDSLALNPKLNIFGSPALPARDRRMGHMVERAQIVVKGIVQGVGFRPFVYNLAVSLNLTGYIANTSEGVFIDIEGSTVPEFVERLRDEAPPLSQITDISLTQLPVQGLFSAFTINVSAGLVADRISLLSRLMSRSAMIACVNCSILPTGATFIRSLTAPTAGPGILSPHQPPMTGRTQPWQSSPCVPTV
jgi:hydrogenase nickel incorporation protein HypB